MNQSLVRHIWTRIPTHTVNTNRQIHTFTTRQKPQGPKLELKIPKCRVGYVDLVIFDPHFLFGTLMRANYAT